MTEELSSLLARVLIIAERAGDAIMPYFSELKAMDLKHKEDKTPLTAADVAAHHEIENGLSQLTPEVPILSEEGEIPSFEQRQQWKRYWLVDPLDGTRGFINKSNEFSVNIALIDHHRPVLGVIYAPVTQLWYYAVKDGGAYTGINGDQAQAMHTTDCDWQQVRLLIGQYHNAVRLKKMQSQVPGLKILRLNSSLKFGKIACGQADFYPRFGPTSEWDTAAGQIILEEAGGQVLDLEGQIFRYNTKPSLLNPAFVALGDDRYKQQVLDMLNALKSS